jgi:hypothetical protein
MSYVRINSTVEYDPATNTVRQDGQTRPAGLAALAFSTVLEVQQQLRAQSPEAPAGDTPVAPAAVVPQLTASGAPLITLRATPASNPWNYTGPAACNPYYTMPGIPLEDGFVKGYEKWFESAHVLAAEGTGASSEGAHTMRVATEEGALEALRLVQAYVPAATLEAALFGAQGGPWRADKPTYYVALPSGGRLDAAAILESYYSRGTGVTALSDLVLRDELRWQTGNPGLGAG